MHGHDHSGGFCAECFNNGGEVLLIIAVAAVAIYGFVKLMRKSAK